jgi:hypothetical protein
VQEQLSENMAVIQVRSTEIEDGITSISAATPHALPTCALLRNAPNVFHRT